MKRYEISFLVFLGIIILIGLILEYSYPERETLQQNISGPDPTQQFVEGMICIPSGCVIVGTSEEEKNKL